MGAVETMISSGWRNWQTHRATASPDARTETKRVIPDGIAVRELAAQSIAGSNPAPLAIRTRPRWTPGIPPRIGTALNDAVWFFLCS